MSDQSEKQDVVSVSHDVNALLTVCIATMWQLEQDVEHPHNAPAAAVRGVLELAQQKWDQCHDALEDAERTARNPSAAAEPHLIGEAA